MQRAYHFLVIPAVLVIAAGALLTALSVAGVAFAMESAAPRAIVYEHMTGARLVSTDSGKPFAPANFTKLMTAAVVFEALAKGEITEATLYPVSEHAWRTGGAPARVTTMFAAVRSEVSVGDLVAGLVVDYANDAAIALAEGLSGSEAGFTARMNELAGRIGLKDSHFANPTGFPDPSARTTLDDVLTLMLHLQTSCPERYRLYGQPEFAWNRITQTNKTREVKTLAGTDGLMLAYDETDGFAGLVSVLRGGRRVSVAVSGLGSVGAREKEIAALVEAAFGDYSRVELFPAGAEVGRVRLFGGALPDVAVTGTGGAPVAMVLPTGDRSAFRLAVVYDGPVPAPVSRGQTVARLEARVDGRLYQSVPLEAMADVPAGDLKTRAQDGFRELMTGWWLSAFHFIAERF